MWGLGRAQGLLGDLRIPSSAKELKKQTFYKQKKNPHSSVLVAVRHTAPSPYGQEFPAEVKENVHRTANRSGGNGGNSNISQTIATHHIWMSGIIGKSFFPATVADPFPYPSLSEFQHREKARYFLGLLQPHPTEHPPSFILLPCSPNATTNRLCHMASFPAACS